MDIKLSGSTTVELGRRRNEARSVVDSGDEAVVQLLTRLVVRDEIFVTRLLESNGAVWPRR
jgi:hypothetical protein